MKTFLRRALLFFAGLAILLAAFHRIENWRGARAWEKWKAEQSAQGVPFEWAQILPPAVPEAENFAAAPVVREAILGTAKPGPFRGLAIPALPRERSLWREGMTADLAEVAAALKAKDAGAWLEPWNATLDEVAEAARRPRCRLPADYAKGEIPLMLGFRSLGRTFRLRAQWRLQTGDAEGALQDVLTSLRIARHLSQEPTFIPQLLRNAVTEFALQPLWEGVAGRKWDDRQLAALQTELEAADLLRGYQLAWQGERIAMQQAMEKPLTQSRRQLAREFFDLSGETGAKEALIGPAVFLLLPRGWLNQNRLTLDRLMLEHGVNTVDPGTRRIVRRDLEASGAWLQRHGRRPYGFLAGLALPALEGQLVRFGRTQASADMALVACALERHRLAQGGLPEALDGLAPAHLKAVPRDLITGEALRYRPAADGTYLLYATGWNGTDEGGVLAPVPATGNRPATEGDWPWPVLKR
jgi:hypothetical protein